MTQMSERTRAQALNALNGMAQIVRNEMLLRGQYVSQDADPEKSGAVCQGHRYCAVGALWAGGGVRAEKNRYGDVRLPGSKPGERAAFLRPRHGLRVAYETLNTAADRYCKRNELVPHTESLVTGPLETLFEDEELAIGRPELLKIINSAQRSLRASA